jgi:hypothetical protein
MMTGPGPRREPNKKVALITVVITLAAAVVSLLLPERRGAAVRSYLRSAPELMVMMWAHEALRRARLGPRRPG